MLAITWKRYLRWKAVEFVQSILSLQQSTSESELLELLHALTIPKLKLLWKENATETSENKANIIGQLVTMWNTACDVSPVTCSTSTAASIDMPALNKICLWTSTYRWWHTLPSWSCTTLWSTARKKCSIISQWRLSNRSPNNANCFGLAAFPFLETTMENLHSFL